MPVVTSVETVVATCIGVFVDVYKRQIQQRAQLVLKKADDLLAKVEKEGLFSTIEKGIFGGVKRPKDGGHGLSGVCSKDDMYFNPFIPLMLGGEE